MDDSDHVELDDALLTLVIGLRAGDLALVMAGGLLEYVHSGTGAVLVLDHRDPRAMRSQRYERWPPQPYPSPHAEERGDESA